MTVSGGIIFTGIIDGKDGADAFNVALGAYSITVALTSDGYLISPLDIYIPVYATYGQTNVLSDCTVTLVSSTDSDFGASFTNVNSQGIRITYDGDTMAYSAKLVFRVRHATYGTRDLTFTIVGVRQGGVGATGKAGKWYDYAGEWNVGGLQSVTNTEKIGYYVLYDGHFYMNVKDDGVANDATPSASSTYWERMADDRNFYIGKAFFGEYAEFGSGIINGDWMLSKNGKIDGSLYANGAKYGGRAAYTYFDPHFPLGTGTYKPTVNTASISGSSYVTVAQFDITEGCEYGIKVYCHRVSGSSYVYVRIYGVKSDGTETLITSGNTTSSTSVLAKDYTLTGNSQYTKIRVKIATGTSTYGVCDDVTVIAVTDGHFFVPQFAVDLLTGETYQQKGYFSGSIEGAIYAFHAYDQGSEGDYVPDDADYFVASTANNSVIILPDPASVPKKVIKVCNPAGRNNDLLTVESAGSKKVIQYFATSGGTDSLDIGTARVITFWADPTANSGRGAWRMIERSDYRKDGSNWV